METKSPLEQLAELRDLLKRVVGICLDLQETNREQHARITALEGAKE